MAVLQWRPGLLSAPVGNNRDNNPDDIINMKDAYARVGRYKKSERNGYIDRELNEAIRGIQNDYNLKRDGYMNPGGETEATLIGEALGIEKKPGPTDPIKTASALPATPAIAGVLMRRYGLPALGMAMEWWKDKSKKEREGVLDDISDSPVLTNQFDDDPNEKPHCEKQLRKDNQKCARAYLKYGNRAGKGCEACAMERYAECRADKPIRELHYWTNGD